MLDAYEGWNAFHYLRGKCGIKVAGVLELKMDTVSTEMRKAALNIFRRGYTMTESKEDATTNFCNFVAQNIPPFFTVSYVGKTKYRVYLPHAVAKACKEGIQGVLEITDKHEMRHISITVEEASEFAGETKVAQHLRRGYEARREKGERMKDALGPLRPLLTGYLERDIERRRKALAFVANDDAILRVTFQGKGRKPE